VDGRVAIKAIKSGGKKGSRERRLMRGATILNVFVSMSDE
jgi:hypothetical protein